MHQSASQPGSDVKLSTERTGKGISASQHLPSNQLRSDRQVTESSSASLKRTGTDPSTLSTSQLKDDRHRPSTPPGRTGKDSTLCRSKSAIQPNSSRNRPGTDPSTTRHASTGKPHSDRHHSSLATDTGSPALHRKRQDNVSSVTCADSELLDRPPVDLYAEEGELSDDQELTTTELDQALSEEQTYRETMSGIRSYMGWYGG